MESLSAPPVQPEDVPGLPEETPSLVGLVGMPSCHVACDEVPSC